MTMNKGRLDLCALICCCVNECLWVTYFKTQSLSLCLHTQPRLWARAHTSQLEYREQPTMGNFTRERGVPTRASSYTAERQRGSVNPLPGGRQNVWIQIEHTVLFYITNNNKIDHIKQHKTCVNTLYSNMLFTGSCAENRGTSSISVAFGPTTATLCSSPWSINTCTCI